MIPERTQVGNLTVVHSIDLFCVSVLKQGLLVPEAIHTIAYDARNEAEAKQAEAIAWAERNSPSYSTTQVAANANATLQDEFTQEFVALCKRHGVESYYSSIDDGSCVSHDDDDGNEVWCMDDCDLLGLIARK